MSVDRLSEHLKPLLRQAERIVVFTGAGVSAESGIPTFRDAMSGLWNRYRAEDLATPEAFRTNPKLVWEWYEWRRGMVATARPNAAHRAIARLQSRIAGLTVITQNVDGLHHRAGSRRVIELHGRLDRARCVACGEEVRGLIDLGPDPRCELCGGRLRPAVVWFGESLPPGPLEAAFERARSCDVMLVIGTSGVVEPAASLADAAREAGATLVEINPSPSDRSHLMHVALRACCGEALQAIDAAWRNA